MPVRILTFTSLFPNDVVPHHGVFVEQRLRHLVDSGEVISKVIAPVPWFPSRSQKFGEYAKFARVSQYENRRGIEVLHPRFLLLPKIGMSVAPLLMALSLFRTLKREKSDGSGFDLIDAHYLYPDGIAATILGRIMKTPVVITARGTDVNLIPKYRVPRMWILWAAREANRIITVSEALRKQVIEIGVDANKVVTLRNGVDLEFFSPSENRQFLRSRHEVSGPTLLSVGHLIERKGHDLIIRALPALPEVSLIIAGEGRLRHYLEELAASLGVAHRVRFVGAVTQKVLVELYNVADALVLASSREGMANVLLESLACGTPVIGSPIWGTPEVITSRNAGVLMRDRSVDAVVESARELLNDPPDREIVRMYAKRFSWDATTAGQVKLFQSLLELN